MEFSKYNFKTFTVTVAHPAVFTSTTHELYTDDRIILETTGALPTGLTADTEYWVIRNGITADTFQLSETQGGDHIVTTGTQSGTHSYLKVNRARLEPLAENNR